MYLLEGIKRRSALNPKDVRLFPWDSSREVKFQDGTTARRCTILIREEMVPFSGYCGLGLIRRADVGRKLTVDFLPDGRKIDVLE